MDAFVCSELPIEEGTLVHGHLASTGARAVARVVAVPWWVLAVLYGALVLRGKVRQRLATWALRNVEVRVLWEAPCKTN